MNPTLWSTFLPGVKMPADCTYREFVEVREQVWRDEDIQFEDEMLTNLQELQDHSNHGFLSEEERSQIVAAYQYLIDQVGDRLARLLANV